MIGNEACVIAPVDDEELVRTSLQRLLKIAGYARKFVTTLTPIFLQITDNFQSVAAF
jgi:FixJ family two-component response regulator